MSWQNGTRGLDVRMPGLSPSMGINVKLAVEQGERPKVLLEERPDNYGAALQEPESLKAAVRDVSSLLNTSANDVDWYVLGEDKEFYPLDVREREITRENPQWTELQNSGDLSVHDHDEARRLYPDVKDREFEVSSRLASDVEAIALKNVFNGPQFAGGELPEAQQYTAEEWRRAEIEQNQHVQEHKQTYGHDPDL